MAKLLSKFNTLLRARIEGFLEESLKLPGQLDRGNLLSVDRLGGDIEAEIAALRRRIDEAITYEENIQDELDALHQTAMDWDVQADNALLENNEPAARHALEQMKRAEQRAAMLEADLNAHRRDTAEFMERVNVLEGLVAEAHRQQEMQADAPPDTTLDAVIKTARQEAEIVEAEEKRLAGTGAPPEESAESAPPDDLVKRRNRLARHPQGDN